MNRYWIIDISTNHQSDVEQIHLYARNSETTPNNIESRFISDALLYVDEDEIIVERIGESSVEIERGDRKRLLDSNHPIRILPKDVIRSGSSEYHIDRIRRVVQMSRRTSQFGQTVNKAILTGAAAMMMVALPACNPSERSNDTTSKIASSATNVNEQAAESDNPSVLSDNLKPEVKNVDSNAEIVNADNENTHPSADNNENEPGDETDSVAALKLVDDPNQSKCNDGNQMCLSNNRYLCENQRWKLVEECKKPAKCKNDTKAGVTSTECANSEPCQDGHYLCDEGNLVYKCENQQWKLEETCPSDKECRLESELKAECVKKRPRLAGSRKLVKQKDK